MCCLVKCFFQFILIVLNLILLLISASFVFFGVMIAWFFPTLLSWFDSLLFNLTPELQTVVNDLLAYLQTYALTIGIVMLCVGAVVFIICSVGLLGLCFKSVGLTIAYSTLVGVLAAGIITVAIIVIVDFSLILSPITTELSYILRSGFDDPDNPLRQGSIANIPPLTAGVITLLRQFPCCGVQSWSEFQLADTWNRTYTYSSSPEQSVPEAKVPVMCCKNRRLVKSVTTNLDYYIPGVNPTILDTSCLKEPTNLNSYVDTTCTQYIESNAAPIGYVLVGIGAVVILIFIIAVALTCTYKKQNSVGSV